VEEGILAGAAVSPVPVMVASTLPELLDDAAAWRFAEAGVPAIAGLRTGVAVAAALAAPAGSARRLREIAAYAERRVAGRWLAEHEAKELLRARGVPIPRGRLVHDEQEALAAFRELGSPVVLKMSSPEIQHKTAIGAIVLDVRDEAGVREAFARLEPPVLVEEMVPPGDEVFVAVRYDAVVPVLVIGKGGTDVERYDDVEIIPLPTPRQAAIVNAADGLALLECNPVIGDVVVDATAQEDAT
jgi:acetyl-CoA synthetase